MGVVMQRCLILSRIFPSGEERVLSHREKNYTALLLSRVLGM